LTDSPRKRREKLAKNFAEDWILNYTNQPTIRYKKYTGIKGFWKKLFGRKHTVFAMY